MRRLLLRQAQRVRRHLGLDRRAHVHRRAEEPVGGDRAVEPLMRSLEVVVLDEQRHPPLTVRKVREHRLAQELLPERLPEALDLPQRLRMLRPALHMRDAVSPQQLRELGLATPRRVLPPLVGQHLARLAVLRHPALDRLQHQRRLLVMRHRPRHEVARVIVQKRRHVQPLIPSQLEREDVALPELVRLRPLEPPRRLLPRCGLLAFDQQPLLVQDAPHRRLRDAEALEPRHHVADPPRSPLGMLAALCDHRGTLRAGYAPRRRPRRRLRCRAAQPWPQRLHPARLEQRQELRHRGDRHPEPHRHVRVPHPSLRRLHDLQPHLQRHGAASYQSRPSLLCQLLLRHPSSSWAAPVTASRATAAMRTQPVT